MKSTTSDQARPTRMKRADRDAQRSLATRTRLLEAAFEVLVERGHSGFNTVAVCARANAPRGTMLHHFPSRASLVVASLDHVLERRVQAFHEAFLVARQQAEALSGSSGKQTFTPRAMLDMLWSEFSGPANAAWLELVSASRTDPEIRNELVEVVKRFDGNARLLFTALIPPQPGAQLDHDRVLGLIFATLNGMSIDRVYRPDFDAEPTLAALTQLAVTLVAREVTDLPRVAPTPAAMSSS